MGLEWSAPNVSHEKGSSINQVSVVLWHSLTNCLAALQGEIQEKAGKLVRVFELHRREVDTYPDHHRLKCLESTRVVHVQAISPNPRNFLSQLAVLGVYCVIMSSRRRLCSRSGAQVSHQSVHRMTDVGQVKSMLTLLGSMSPGRAGTPEFNCYFGS